MSGLSPRFRTVSIMPGMETAAPERTETRRGLSPRPKVLPEARSSRSRAWSSSGRRASGTFSPAFAHSSQVSVVIVKPGGTGIPRRVIS